MRIKTITVLLICLSFKSFSQNKNCDSVTSEKKVLWTYDTDNNKKLYYTILYYKHNGNGICPIKITITKSDESDTTEIRGILKTDVGYFDIKEKDSSVTTFNSKVSGQTAVWGKNEKQSIPFVWESWFGMYTTNIISKQLPEISFIGNCVDPNAYAISNKGFPWERFDEQNIFPDWFRKLIPDVMTYDAKTGIFKYGDKQYNLNEGAGQLISISPIIFQQKWIRDKFWEFLKEHMKDYAVEKVTDHYIDNLFKKETAENIKFIRDAIENGKDLKTFTFFLIKNVTLKSVDAGDAKLEGADLKFEQQFISQHPEIKAPSDLFIDKQFHFIINKLVLKTIMQNKNVSEVEAERILKSNPEIEKFTNPYYSSAIRQN